MNLRFSSVSVASVIYDGGVVIALDARVRRQRPDGIHARVGVGTVPDDIAQTDIKFHALFVSVRQNRLEGLQVAVDVREYQVFHTTPFRNSFTSRSSNPFMNRPASTEL